MAKHASMNTPEHVVFSGGGTGGHLFPGLAVAEHLRAYAPDVRISFCGAGTRFERNHVFQAGFAYQGFPCRPLPRSLKDGWKFLTRNREGTWRAAEFIAQEQVSLVVGLGGYASFPMARAAAKSDVPLILLEQNAVPGRATRWLGGRANLACLAMVEAERTLRRSVRCEVTGNPLRRAFEGAGRAGDWEGRDRQLVVLGGSQGAEELNQQVPRALYKAREAMAGWQVVHQCGLDALRETERLYAKLKVPANVVPFVESMPELLGASQLAICRAGGTTLAELAACGVPAVLVPYRWAAKNHQRRNADVYTAAGATVTVDDRDLPGRLDDSLAEAIVPLLDHLTLRRGMAKSMQTLAKPNAASDVAERIVTRLGFPARSLAA